MAKKTATLLPATDALLRQFGERLRLARLRRRLLAKQVAERAGMAPMTLRSLERGGAGVTIGAYLAVMQVLGIEQDLDLLGQADPLGRELQDARLPARHPAATRMNARTVVRRTASDRRVIPTTGAAGPAHHTRDWIRKSGFASADALAKLIQPAAAPKKSAR